MGCRVDEAEVGFDLGDAAGEALAVEIADEELAEEGSRDDLGGAGVEGSWKKLDCVVWMHSVPSKIGRIGSLVRSKAAVVSVISRKITRLILVGSTSPGVRVHNGALEKPPIERNDVRPITVEGDKALCAGYGVVSDVSSKVEMEHIIHAVVQPLMNRIRV